MIDLHSHILPAIDDGASDLEESIAMARVAAGDGITCMACTPHIVPGLYENCARSIRAAVGVLQQTLRERGIRLKLVVGADVRIAPDLAASLGTGRVPTLNGTRYFLFEPTHNVLPPRIEALTVQLMDAGYVPILTHPERLRWIGQHYDTVERLNALGCLLQVTAGSVVGAFGKTARYYADRLLDEGRVDILASDAHDTRHRPPVLSEAFRIVAERIGDAEAKAMVSTRPATILADRPLAPQGRNATAENVPRHGTTNRQKLSGLLKKWIRGGTR